MIDWHPIPEPNPADPPLTGVRVLDLSRILAGPWATQALADLGADVVKVERPGTGDDTRGWGPPWVESDGERTAAYFHCANRNKRSVAVDLRTQDGADTVRALADGADVVVENFPLRAGAAGPTSAGAAGPVHALAAHGLDPASLRARRPALIVCSITGYGHTGPRAAEPGYDAMIQAASGHMSVTGDADGPPLKIGVALMDVMTGLYAANAVQAALIRRARTASVDAPGRGEHIDLSLFDVAVATLANQAMNRLATGRDPGRLGTAHPNIVPYQGFACADGDVMLAVGGDAQFVRLAAMLGRADLIDGDEARVDGGPDNATNAGRVANRDALVPALAALIGGWKREAFLAACAAASIPAGPINTVGEALADPQSVARGLVLDLGGAPGIRSPFRFEEAATAEPRPAPPLDGR